MHSVSPSTDKLQRPLNPMPDDIARLLSERGLKAAYAVRPAYQRNDYLGWIAAAKRPETRQRRIDQMLEELEAGEAYMRMPYHGPKG